MRLRSLRFVPPALVSVTFIVLSMAISACGNPPTPPVGATTTPTTPPANALITWPFHPSNNDQWAIVNAYRGNLDHAPGGSPNNYALFALDFAKCLPAKVNTVSESCDLSNGWTHTAGAPVYAPVSGTIAWPDDSCLGASINIDGYPGFRVVLFHVNPLPGTTWSQLANSNPPKHFDQGDPIGTVSAGGCIGSGNHIHMALYSCTACLNDPGSQRVGQPFSGLWSIGGCPFKDDNKTSNEYLGVLVPCRPNATVSPTPTTPTPTSRQLSSVQTASQTVNATGQRTAPGISASGMLTVANFDPNKTFTFSAGQTFSNSLSTPIQMVLDANVTVPPAPTGASSTAMVPAHVIPVGTIGNIAPENVDTGAGFRYVITESNGLTVQLFNHSSFTGGQNSQTYTVVQQSDIDTATNALKTSTKQSAVADLNSQLRPNEHLVGNPQCTYNVTSDHTAGDKANTVTVTVKTTCTATAST